MQNLLNMFAELMSPKKETKKADFAVVMTDKGSEKLYIKKFKRLLKEFPFLLQNPNDTRTLSSLSYGDIVVFGNSSSFDYTILTGNTELMKLKNVTLYDVVTEESRIADALEYYIEKNSAKFFQSKSSPKNDDVIITITIEDVPKPKAKKVATIEVPDFYDAFVKIGWNIYYVTVDTWTGKEYINVNGNVLEIKKNIFGQKYLSA